MFGGVFVNFFLTHAGTSAAQVDLNDIEAPIVPTMIIFYFGFFYASVFQNVFDIASRTILQCYLMDEEMFVGEQRYVEKHILEVMEYYKRSMNYQEDSYADAQKYVTGIAATKKVQVRQFEEEEDPDALANKKLEREAASESSSEEEIKQESSSSSSSGSGSDYTSGSDSSDDARKISSRPKFSNILNDVTPTSIQKSSF